MVGGLDPKSAEVDLAEFTVCVVRRRRLRVPVERVGGVGIVVLAILLGADVVVVCHGRGLILVLAVGAAQLVVALPGDD